MRLSSAFFVCGLNTDCPLGNIKTLKRIDKMDNKLEKRYGLFTAICMVVGIVIGSGVFFKSQDILKYTGGSVTLGVLAWVIGGIVMMICSYNFANFATKYVKVNGVVDYSEAIVGKKYAYFMGWFVSTIYYPAMTAVLAWVSARYTLVLFGASASDSVSSGLCIALGTFYMIVSYVLNILSPKLAGQFQVSSTVIKLIPLVVMAIVGTAVGLFNGTTLETFKHVSSGDTASIFGAIVAAAFAYEGWVIATSINAELKNPKKNLPIALISGAAIIMIVYIIYFISVTGGATVDEIIEFGPNKAFTNIFGNIGGTLLYVFVVISCLGTLNGLMLATTRSMYSISVREVGPKPEMFSELSKTNNMPVNSGVIGLLMCSVWYFYFYGANLWSDSIFGVFSFDSSELPIITIYALYIPMFVIFIIKEGKHSIVKNVIMPILAILSSLFMIFCAVYAHGVRPYLSAKENGEFSFPILFYLIVFAVIMGIGALLYKKKTKN